MNNEREGLINRRFSRRTLLKGGGLLAAGSIGVGVENGITPREVFNSLAVAYEYGPDVAMAVLTHPEQSLEAYRLWKRPEKEYEKLHFFEENLVYKEGAPNAVIGFGDSNLVGAEGDGSKWRESPVHLFTTMAQTELGFSGWKDFNCAIGGSTTETVVDVQVDSPKAKEGFDYSPKCDVWINAGGNDVSSLVQSVDEVDELQSIATDPFKNLNLLFKYTGRIEDNLKKFEDNFFNLLNSIHEPYSSRIRQFIIMSAPDFGKANSFVTQEISGVPYIIPIQNSAIRRLIENISVEMNNGMFRAAQKFQNQFKEEQGRDIRIVGIDTSTPQLSDFARNQHLSVTACNEIAEQAYQRIRIAA